MKTPRYIVLLIAIIMLTPSICAQDNDDSDPSRFIASMFRKKTEEWRQAYNSKDAQNLIQFYSEDAQYIAADVPGLAATGRVKVISWLQKSIDEGSHMDSLEILSLNISDNLATVYCRYQISTKGVITTGRNIMTLKKSGLKWVIYLHMVVE